MPVNVAPNNVMLWLMNDVSIASLLWITTDESGLLQNFMPCVLHHDSIAYQNIYDKCISRFHPIYGIASQELLPHVQLFISIDLVAKITYMNISNFESTGGSIYKMKHHGAMFDQVSSHKLLGMGGIR